MMKRRSRNEKAECHASVAGFEGCGHSELWHRENYTGVAGFQDHFWLIKTLKICLTWFLLYLGNKHATCSHRAYKSMESPGEKRSERNVSAFSRGRSKDDMWQLSTFRGSQSLEPRVLRRGPELGHMTFWRHPPARLSCRKIEPTKQ